jgi:competence protein ComEC
MAFPFFPALRIVVVMIIGIILPEFIAFKFEYLFVLFLGGLMLTLVGEIVLHASPRPVLSYWVILGYHVTLLGFSISYTLLSSQHKAQGMALHNLNSFHSIPLEVHAQILQVYTKASGDYRVLVETSLILLNNDTLTLNPVKISLNWADDTPRPTLNELLKATIRLKEWSILKNPYDFNYQTYLQGQGIYYTGYVDHIQQRKMPTTGYSLLSIRSDWVKSIEDLFDTTTVPIAKALIIGDKGSLSDDTKEDFKRSGLSHLMAVSGLHVVFVVSPLLLFIPFTYRHTVLRHLLFITIVIVLVIYCGITGNSASVLRAALMFGIYSLAKIYRRVHHGFNTLAFSALLLLLYDPDYLWDIGFQLSYLAVFAIILSNPLIQKLKPRLFHRPVVSQIWDIAGMSAMIQFALTPLLLLHFGSLSFTGLVLNIAAIPLTQGILSSSMLLLFLHAIDVPVQPLATLTDEAIKLLLYLAKVGGSWSISYWSVSEMHGSLLIVLFITFLLLLTWNHYTLRWKLVGLMFMLILMVQIQQVIKDRKGVLLHVLFLDVGQGDATLIWSDQRNAWLIDAGVLSQGYNSGEAIIWPILQRLGIQRLNKVILSHPHLDHTGGILSLLSLIPIDTLYEAKTATPSLFVLSYRSKARSVGTPIQQIEAGDRLFFDAYTRAYVLAPILPLPNADPNSASIILKLQVGATSFLFTGDADAESEQRVVDQYPELLPSTVLKAGHHGSKTSSSEVFIKRVNPKLVVVSLGWKNKYQHPHPEVIARIKKQVTSNIHYTSLEGALWLTTDGYSFIKQRY